MVRGKSDTKIHIISLKVGVTFVSHDVIIVFHNSVKLVTRDYDLGPSLPTFHGPTRGRSARGKRLLQVSRDACVTHAVRD